MSLPFLAPLPQRNVQLQGQALTAAAENAELKVELLRWRKKAAILRLKLASAEEDAAWRAEHTALAAREAARRQAALQAARQDNGALQDDTQRLQVGGAAMPQSNSFMCAATTTSHVSSWCCHFIHLIKRFARHACAYRSCKCTWNASKL